ncbi:Nup85 Nucleoporin [Gracilaria domingensis]|nr:Nup85 Nucleoporin [Gracilaria domingensis]
MATTIWHLVEILFIRDRTQTDDHISVELVEWFKANFPEQRPDADAISNSTSLSNDELWNLIAKSVLCGNIAGAQSIVSTSLQNASELEQDPEVPSVQRRAAEKRTKQVASRSVFKALHTIFEKAPSNSIQTRRDQSWSNWQTVCHSWSASDDLADHPVARQVFQVLSGNHQAIAALCSTWEEMFVACAMYLPEENGFENNLRSGLRTVISASAEASMVKAAPKDGVGLALVEASMGNCFNALVIMEITLPTAWFSAHLGELLVRVGQVSDTHPLPAENSNIGVKERFFIRFAEELESYPGFWRIAADYYMACPTLGNSRLIDLLMRKEFDGGMDAEKALHLCHVRNLPKTARRIQTMLGSQCLEYNNLGGAVSWYATAGAIREAQKVVDLALQAAEREGPDSNGGLLLINVVNAINKFANEDMRQAFDYLDVYKSMQEQLKILAGMKAAQEGDETHDESQEEAVLPAVSSFVHNICTLLVGGGLPRRYWCVVVFEAVRVLEEFPEASRLFPRSALRSLITALELSAGPHAADILLEGIRSRLKWERNALNVVNMELTDVRSVEDLTESLGYCRKILSKAMARAINQS